MSSGPILIIANSGRMLVEAASRAGFKALAVDLFGDCDIRRLACDYRKVKTLASAALEPALCYFQGRYDVSAAVYGSGFENFPDSLDTLQTRFMLSGNDASTFRRLQQRDRDFFAELSRLAIPFPDIAFEPPSAKTGWLFKPTRGQGGLGIRSVAAAPPFPAAGYWQRFQPGLPCSVLFLANGRRFQIIGFHRQWTVAAERASPFVFAGLVNRAALTFNTRTRIAGWLERLVPAFGLKGLNGLDFIHCRNRDYILEINPRPPASLELYAGNVFAQHLETSLGCAPGAVFKTAGYRAYRIVYAPGRCRIPDGMAWPAGCKDLPPAGTIINTGRPICSMIAHQKNRRSVFAQLTHTEHAIINQLEKV